MAISIDTVYQKVLAIANKEQRGYITPQEFNLFASQAQSLIFHQYFSDINKALNIDSKLPDRLSYILKEKENFKIINNNINEVKKYIVSKLI